MIIIKECRQGMLTLLGGRRGWISKAGEVKRNHIKKKVPQSCI